MNASPQLPDPPQVEESLKQDASQLDHVRSYRRAPNEANSAETALLKAQLKEIQAVQKEEEKLIESMRTKQTADYASVVAHGVREQEHAIKQQEKELDKLVAKNTAELETYTKAEATDEKKFMKMMKEKLAVELSAFQESKKKERKHLKEEVKQEMVTAGVKSSLITSKLKDLKAEQLVKIAAAEEVFVREQEAKAADEYKVYRINKLVNRQAVLRRHTEEVRVVATDGRLNMM